MFCKHKQAALSTGLAVRILSVVPIAGIGMLTELAILPPVFAAEWTVTPSLRLGYEHNDNIRMTLQPHNTVDGSTIAPGLDMGVRSEIWGITGTAEAARKRYSGDQGLDSNNETFRLSSFYKMERNNFTLNASRKNDTTLAQEFEDFDVGLVTVQRVRRTETIQPTWTWSMSERAQVLLSYQLSEVSYVDGQSDGLFDYQWREATATWSYWVSPLNQFFITANYSKYRVPSTNVLLFSFDDGSFLVDSTISAVNSKTPSVSVGMTHTFSETMQGTLALGRRKTSAERTVIDCVYFSGGTDPIACVSGFPVTHDTGTTFSGNLKKSFEKLDIRANVSRSLAASGAGTEIETDVLSIRLDHPMSARLKAALTANGSESRRIAGATTLDTNIKQYSIQPGLNWQWTPEADLSISYRYRHLKRESEARAAQAHALSLGLVYTWPKYSISR